MPEPGRVFGLKLEPMTYRQATERVVLALRTDGPAYWLGNLNVNAINLSLDDSSVFRSFAAADSNFCDGMGLAILLKMAGYGSFPQVTYNQWLDPLFAALARTNARIFLLGDEYGVLERAARKTEAAHPGMVAGFRDGFFPMGMGDVASPAESEVVEQIRSSGADVLLVAMGMPRQEHFIAKHRAKLGVRVILNGGACLKFYVGDKPVAPAFIASLGLEWAFRLALEPQRLWRRYLLGNPKFIWRLIRERRRSGRQGRSTNSSS